MAFMTWSDDFATGLDRIDRQHRHLMDMINTAAPLLLDCSPAQQAERQGLFNALLAYTTEHFRTEEDLMRAWQVDARVFDHHVQTHAKLVDDVLTWQRRLSCADPLSGQQLLGFLAGWLLFHVMGEDQTMARQIHAIRAGMPAGRAYMDAEGARLTPSEAALSKTITGLYSQLSAQIRTIGLANRHLEDQVRARTGDLAAMAEELRQARDAAEAASQAKSRFLAMVSHELRTPLNAIVGFTDTLRRDGLGPGQDQLAGRVQAASRQLAELIDGLIEYSRDNPGQQVQFDLRGLLAEACQTPFQAARAKGLRVSLELAPELPEAFRGDARRIALVIRQLAANAAKFTSKGWIRVRAEPIGPAPEGRLSVRLSVTDTGVGIAAEKQDGLFEAFHQIDDSSTRTYGGVGLGLALTRQAARMMGGELGLISRAGRGSRFWLELSLAPAQADASMPARPPIPVAAAPAPAPERAPGPADTDILRRLEKLLGEDDTRAGELLVAAEAGLRGLLGDRFERLAGQIADFEYDRALTTLKTLTAPDDDHSNEVKP